MKMIHLIAVAILALGLAGATVGFVNAHHNSSHSQGPCGPNPCPPKAYE
ncbi:MAG: hypothetical protein K2X43_08205 [Hyphomonadaceae bacterium]|nr:hypothetical protein [Hyphomonadaceae bacterium]